MGNEVMSIKERLAALRKEAAERQVALPSNKLKIDSGMWVLPTGKTSPEPITVVPLDWAYLRAYFPKPFNPANPEPPTCFALSLEPPTGPDSDAPERQARTCEECPFNEWGSAPNSRGKACREKRRLLFCAPDAAMNSEPLLLEVPPTSHRAFDGWVNSLPDRGVPFMSQLRMSLTSKGSYSVISFEIVEPDVSFLTEDRLAVYLELRSRGRAVLLNKPAGRE